MRPYPSSDSRSDPESSSGEETNSYPIYPPPPLCPAPSLVLPWGMGGGGPSLGQHKKFCFSSLCCCVGDCVVRHCHLYPLYPWQDILLIFAEMEFDSTVMFIPGTNVMFIHSTGEPVLAQVVGYSEHSDAYRHISFEREGKRYCQCIFRFAVQFLCLKVCVYGGSAVPHGVGGGGPSLGNRPAGGGGGPSSLGWGRTRGGGRGFPAICEVTM